MKGIYLIVTICLFTACDESKSDHSSTPSTHPEMDIVNDSLSAEMDDSTAIEMSAEILEIPVIGKFDLNTMNVDSVKAYEGGDCWGTIRRYSSPTSGLAIDSVTCGEFGYTYAYYLLSTKDFIEVVYVKKSESVWNVDTDSFCYIQQEQVTDFNAVPVITLTKSDTVYDYQQRDHKINKEFVTETLKDTQTMREILEMNYKGTWATEEGN